MPRASERADQTLAPKWGPKAERWPRVLKEFTDGYPLRKLCGAMHVKPALALGVDSETNKT